MNLLTPTDKFPNPLLREDCSPEEIEAIEQGFADIAAGHIVDGNTLLTDLYAQVGLSCPVALPSGDLNRAAIYDEAEGSER